MCSDLIKRQDVIDRLYFCMDRARSRGDEACWDNLADFADIVFGHCAPKLRIEAVDAKRR